VTTRTSSELKLVWLANEPFTANIGEKRVTAWDGYKNAQRLTSVASVPQLLPQHSKAKMNSLESLDKGSYRISAAKGDLTNTAGATPDRLGGFSRAEQQQHTEPTAETSSSNETSTSNAGLSATECRTPCETFASPRGCGVLINCTMMAQMRAIQQKGRCSSSLTPSSAVFHTVPPNRRRKTVDRKLRREPP